MFRTPILFSPPESTSGIFQGLRRAESEPVVSPTKPAASGDRPGSPTVQLFEELMNARKESPRSATSSTAATAGEDEWPGMAASAIADDWPKTSAASVKSSGDELFGVDFQPAASFDFGAGLAVKNGGSGEQPSREIADALINGVKKYTEAAPALTEKGLCVECRLLLAVAIFRHNNNAQEAAVRSSGCRQRLADDSAQAAANAPERVRRLRLAEGHPAVGLRL